MPAALPAPPPPFAEIGSIPKPGAVALPGEGVPHVCSFTSTPIVPPPPGVSCAYDLFRVSAESYPSSPCIGYRPIDPSTKSAGPYTFLSYAETRSLALRAGSALVALNVPKGSKIGVYGKNCPAWCIAQLAASAQGMVLVPVYDTLGPTALQYIVNHAEVHAIFVTEENLPKFIAAQAECPNVKFVIVMPAGDPCRTDIDKKSATDALTLAELCEKGSDDPSTVNTSGLEDLYVIMYTSGTTGDPKGVMLRNRAMVVTVRAMEEATIFFKEEIKHTDIFYSFLPLAHIFAQQIELFLLYKAARIGYYQGDVKLILDDLLALKPTVFIGVPRVYARFEENIMKVINSGSALKKKIFDLAYSWQLYYVANQLPRSRILDAIVFNKIREKILPNCRYGITGSAPLSAATNDFLKVCLNMPVMQGYGLTECVGGMVCSTPKSKSGHCGILIPAGEIKLVDVPDMNYFSTDEPCPRGEIWLKGDNITIGYYKNKKATEEALTEDGWFKTGDIGQWLPDGNLQIIDRKKNLFKLSQGEYVSPELLEQEYSKCPLVSQIFIYGNSFKNCLVGIVVPNMFNYKAWAEANGHAGKSFVEVAAVPEFKDAVAAQLKEMKTKAKFKGYETVYDFRFETDVNELGQGFTVENDLMTPTFKLKRPQLTKKYQKQIDEMYAIVSEAEEKALQLPK